MRTVDVEAQHLSEKEARVLRALARVPAARLLEPPKDGRPLVPGYPLPCVDHQTERDRTLAIFKKHRERAGR